VRFGKTSKKKRRLKKISKNGLEEKASLVKRKAGWIAILAVKITKQVERNAKLVDERKAKSGPNTQRVDPLPPLAEKKEAGVKNQRK
jgi:hypothetical protein